MKRGFTLEFDANQKKAITTIDNPLMIISTAGSGKTSVIIARANYIVKKGIKPYRILVVTFSKMAALEMQSRYNAIYNEAGVRFSTIHSLCYSVLARAFSFTADSILKESDKRTFFTSLHRRLLIQKTSNTPNEFDEFYSNALSYISAKLEADYLGERKICKEKYLLYTYNEYIRYKTENKKIDFDDMIIQCHKCLSESISDLEYWRSVFDYIMIDEFQDTSRLQAEILYMISNDNICVVGDDDQSIYGFRGADAAVFDDFLRRYPTCEHIYLDTNYRSLPAIVDSASKVIQNNRIRLEKDIKANRKGDELVGIVEVYTDTEQVNYVINEIEKAVANGINRNEIAVLYRTKKDASTLINALQFKNIPFYTKDMPEDVHWSLCYKDVFAYYRLSLGDAIPEDLLQIINRPKRYIKVNSIKNCSVDKNELYTVLTRECSRREADRINDIINDLFIDLRNLKALQKPIEFVNYLEHNMGYFDSLQDYVEYIGSDLEVCIKEYESMKYEARNFNTMSDWYQYVCNSDYKKEFDKENGVCLSTFHSAKGLEWKNVYIISAIDGTIPYRYMGKIEDIEEERRLFYVAMTRAKDKLTISYVTRNNPIKDRSRFLNELLA